MLTLYYAPGACSMASHIALEETGAPYQTQLVGLAQGEQTKPEYLNKVNPRGKVPALHTDDGILTENVAILTYLSSPSYIELLWITNAGKIALVCSAMWMSVGIGIMKKMISFDF